jgi:hypothetical protein
MTPKRLDKTFVRAVWYHGSILTPHRRSQKSGRLALEEFGNRQAR